MPLLIFYVLSKEAVEAGKSNLERGLDLSQSHSQAMTKNYHIISSCKTYLASLPNKINKMLVADRDMLIYLSLLEFERMLFELGYQVDEAFMKDAAKDDFVFFYEKKNEPRCGDESWR